MGFRATLFHTVCAAVLTGMLLPGSFAAHAQTQSSSEQYLALRRVNPPRSDITLKSLEQAEDSALFSGAILEVTGSLTCIGSGIDGDSRLSVTTKDGDATFSIDDIPEWLQPGQSIRVLAVVVPPDSHTIISGIPDLKAIAIATASNIDAAEWNWRQTAVARAARDRQTQSALRAAGAALDNGALKRNSFARAPRVSGAAVPVGTPLFGYLSPSAKAAYPRYLAYVRKSNRRLTDSQADAIATSILLFSERYAVDPRLIVALIIAESDFKPREISNKGAMGLGQLMPDEVQSLGLSNPYDPTQNIAGAVYLLRGRLDKYSAGGDLTMQHVILALASYNAGMGAVKKYGGVPPYRETQNYVKRIEKLYRQLCGQG